MTVTVDDKQYHIYARREASGWCPYIVADGVLVKVFTEYSPSYHAAMTVATMWLEQRKRET